MIRAQERGVQVWGVFDESQARGRYSKDEVLALAGVPVWIDGNKNASGFSGGKLHHKVMLIDVESADPVIVTGSFNWSKSGTHYNDENTVILREDGLAELYRQEFCRVVDVATLHPDFSGEITEPCAKVTAQLFINEVLPNPVGTDRPAEFVEIVNGSTSSVDLTGWAIHDLNGERHVFEGVVLAAGDAIVVTGESSSTGYLSLNNGAEAVILASPAGDIVDFIEYGTSREGETWNRLVDGDPTSGWDYADPTPGTRDDGSPWVAEPVVVQLIINELLPNPSGTDLGQEFIEIVNVGDYAADLTGWTVGDLSKSARHIFDGTVLEPGDAVVIWDRGEHPFGLNASSELLSLNNSGDVVTLYNADGEAHDSIGWTASSEGVSLNRAVDGVAGEELADHDSLSDSDDSPGLRADGSTWLD